MPQWRKILQTNHLPLQIITLCGVTVFLLRANPALEVGWVLVVYVTTIIALSNMLKKNQLRSTIQSHTLPTTETNIKEKIASLMVMIIFVINCLRYYDIAPVLLVGEWNNTFDKAMVIPSLGMGLKATIAEILGTYNWGFSLLYGPLKPLLGETQNAVKIFTIGVWAITITLFLWVFCRTYKIDWITRLSLSIPLVSNALLMTIRSYKWHSVAAVATTMVFLILYQIHIKNKKPTNTIILSVSLILLSFCVVMYHGTIIYLPIMSALILISLLYERRESGSVNVTAIMVAIISGFLFVFMVWCFKGHNTTIFNRYKYVLLENSDHTTLYGNIGSFFKLLLTNGSSAGFAIIFLLGISSAVAQWKESTTSRMLLSMFIIMFLLLLSSYGATTPEENSYIIMPILGMAFLGCKTIFDLMQQYMHRCMIKWCCVVLIATLTIIESEKYYVVTDADWFFHATSYPFSENMAALELIDIKQKLAIKKPMTIYFPSKEHKLFDEGGFEDSEAIYELPYFKDELKAVNFYNTNAELQKNIEQQLSKNTSVPIYAYYYKPEESAFDIKKALTFKNPNIKLKVIERNYPEAWGRKNNISYVIAYIKTDQTEPDALLSPYFQVHNNPEEPLRDRVTRFARILRGNDQSQFF